ncbi:hypothetical protein RRG08_010477 [Elysia crispata]|uniref:Uncharacterized protein n=1 Tax=Elysia crispata TaxID=231223 RepID=A0AAE1ANQ5_9GAST|nr:hypothetical protein RRG08_010477 [Elysia crispata]
MYNEHIQVHHRTCMFLTGVTVLSAGSASTLSVHPITEANPPGERLLPLLLHPPTQSRIWIGTGARIILSVHNLPLPLTHSIPKSLWSVWVQARSRKAGKTLPRGPPQK